MLAIAQQPDTSRMQFSWIDVDQIRRSPLNHRTLFLGIKALGIDLAANGCRVPIKVRPTGDPAMPFELVYGERRWRAAIDAGVKQLPALIQVLTDEEVVAEQLVENVSRLDVHPLEEAECYANMIAKHGYTVERINAKTGKSESTIRARLKLRELPKSAHSAFIDGMITLGVAEAIARLPMAEHRERLTALVLPGKRENFFGIDAGDEPQPKEAVDTLAAEVLPYSVREVQVLAQRHFMCLLKLAPFDITDAKLTPAGSCTGCVHRTGNQPDLFGDAPSDDICTNPPCFAEKKQAAWDVRAAAAKAEGKRILTTTEVESVFQGDRLTFGAPYLDLKADADWEFQPKDGGPRVTWEDALGKATPETVLARDPSGGAHELVDRREAMENLRNAGKLPREVVAQEQRSDSTADKRAREKKEIARLVVEAVAVELAADCDLNAKTALWIAECVIRMGSPEAHEACCRRRCIEPKRGKPPRQGRELALLDVARGTKDLTELAGLVRELLAWEPNRGEKGSGENLTSAAKAFGIDLKRIQKRIEDERKAKRATPKAKKGGK